MLEARTTVQSPPIRHRYLVHEAGPFNGKVQACTRCGGHLIYYGNAVYRGHDAPESWPVGARVGVSINTRPTRSFELGDRELDPDEELCVAQRKEG